MSPEQEDHLDAIIADATTLIDHKYRAGQRDHGGNLWEKDGLLDEAIAEAVDQVIYLLTIKRNLSAESARMRSVRQAVAADRLDDPQ